MRSFLKKKTEESSLEVPAEVPEADVDTSKEETKIDYQARIERLRLMKLFSKFSLSVGQRIFIILPGTNSALCTRVEEAFMGHKTCYFTVRDSLQNLTTGGHYSSYGTMDMSKVTGNRVYFDISGFFFVCGITNDRIQIHVETIVEAMQERYAAEIDGQIAICQQYIDLEKAAAD